MILISWDILESLNDFKYGRSSRIRTYDPLVPNQVHYQAVLCSDFSAFIVSHIVRYGVHSRRDALRRQHLLSKKVKNPYQMYI